MSDDNYSNSNNDNSNKESILQLVLILCRHMVLWPTNNVQITNGSHIGDYALIPSTELSPSDSLFSFKLSRRQFSVKLCFPMTINKAQGQSINNLGV